MRIGLVSGPVPIDRSYPYLGNMAHPDPLKTYRDKRSADRTPEPFSGGGSESGRAYVIQKHAARRLHYDFRLELNGALLSWAVPNGPSRNPADKQLAVH